MSMFALTWAFEQPLPCAHKFVLVALADSAGHDKRCWPSQKTIALKAGLSRSRVNVILGELEEQGYISFDTRRRGDGSDTSCIYTLSLPEKPKELQEISPTVYGDIYVISANNMTKVGIARDSARRIVGLRTAVGAEVITERTWRLPMPLTRQIERRVIAALAEYRTAGEWFSCGANTVIDAVLAEIGVSCDETPPVAPEDTGCSTGRHPRVLPEDTNEPSISNHHLTKNTSGRKTLVSEHLVQEEFPKFYEAYPRRIGRRTAENAYRAALGRARPETILAGASRYATATIGQDRQFVKHPATWLNSDGWLDEVQHLGNGNGNGKLSPHDSFLAGGAAFLEKHFADIEREAGEGGGDQH